MTRISQLPATAAAITAADLIEGERIVGGASEKWSQQQIVGGYKPMQCSTRRASGFGIGANVQAEVYWGTPDFDPFGMCQSDPNHHQIKIPVGGRGLWLIGTGVALSGNAGAGVRAVWLRVNGNTSDRRHQVQVQAASASPETVLTTSGVLQLNDNDIVTVVVYQTSSGSVTFYGDATSGVGNRFWAVRLGSY